MIKSKDRYLASFLLLIYIAARFYFDILTHDSVYSPYLFESLFVLITFLALKPQVSFFTKITKQDLAILFITLFFGGIVYKGASLLHFVIPFDFSSAMTLLFLLGVAPILEELIFRFSLWECFNKLQLNPKSIIALTSVMFALGHFVAYFSIGTELRPFIFYQTAYVFFLAIYLGIQRERTRSLSYSILLHFLFNLGFFITSRLG